MDIVGGGVEAELGEAVEDRLHGDRGLHAGEVHPEAGVGAEGEGDVLLRGAENVELVGALPALGIPVGGAHAHVDHRPGGDRHAVDGNITGRPASDPGQRRLPPDALLDGLGQERAVGL